MTATADSDINLDSLLEDLDNVVSPKRFNQQGGGGHGGGGVQQTVKFTPHPPQKEKSPSQMNPKTRFAINPGETARQSPGISPGGKDEYSSSASHNTHYHYNHSPGVAAGGHGKTGGGDGDDPHSPISQRSDNSENAIDNLLSLVQSPKVHPVQASNNSNNTNNSINNNNNNNNEGGAAPASMFFKPNRSSPVPDSSPSAPSYRTQRHLSASPTNASNSNSNQHQDSLLSNSFDSPPSTHSGSTSSGVAAAAAAVHPSSRLFSPENSSSSRPGSNQSASRPNHLHSGSGSGMPVIGSSGGAFSSNSSSSSSKTATNGNNNNNKNNGQIGSGTTTSATVTNNNISSTKLFTPSGHNHSNNNSSSSGSMTEQYGNSIKSTASSSTSGKNSGSGNSLTSVGPGIITIAPPSATASNGGPKTRCSRVTLAGPAATRGLKQSSFSKNACDNMRCLQCNFTILCFHNAKWDDGADYMFFRNNMPNEAKLRPMLRPQSDSSAYCCQCTSASVGPDERVLTQGSSSDPQWMCAGH